MKKNYSQLICGILLTLGFCSAFNTKAQLIVSCTPTTQCYNGTNQVTCTVTNTVAGTATYSWSYLSYPCGGSALITSTSSSVVLNLPCVGNYSIMCNAISSSSTSLGGYTANVLVTPSPTLSATGASSLCLGYTTTLSALGAMTYTWSNMFSGATIVVTPTASTCYSVIGTNANGCTAMAVHCISLSPQAISISPFSASVCEGSSVSFTASGASTYTWNTTTPTIGSTITVIPTTYYSAFSVTGINANGCYGTYSVFVTMDTTCANVWPGDANSDGVVNTSDVFEIGLSFNSTGTARTGGNNTYTSQFANTWTGNGSTGKNKCHIDCNGDGSVNFGDTVAIYNNFSLTHNFKSSESSAANSDISLVGASAMINEGMWQKADIMLGSSSSQLSNLYGVAFDIDFDNSLIESNSAYVVYTPSFLNASNQNVQFRKPNFTAGKIYAASVRANGNNVSGNGKIGEFWFRVKTGLPANSVLSMGISNSSKIDNTGLNSTLSGGSTTLTVVRNLTGLNESSLFNSIQLFPNPASTMVTLQSDVKGFVSYSICDIVGRIVVKGEFTTSKIVDLSDLSKGTYLVRLENGSDVTYKKLILEN